MASRTQPIRLELRCLACGYGVVVTQLPLPVCPMCRARSWARAR